MKDSKDSLGDRMKENERSHRTYIDKDAKYVGLRLDGKAFHTFARKFEKPFDYHLMNAMNTAMFYLCRDIQDVVIGYCQSDEITIIIKRSENPNAQLWFGGQIGKILSISASIAAAEFNHEISKTHTMPERARFDSRVMTFYDHVEAENSLIWRQQDWIRNSVSMVGQSNYSHSELHGVNTLQLKEKLKTEKNIDWNALSDDLKYGRICVKQQIPHESGVLRSRWAIEPSYHFLDDRIELTKTLTNDIGS